MNDERGFDEFIHNLHFDIDKVRPIDLKVNYDDSPLPYKLYMEVPEFPLPLDPSCLSDGGSIRFGSLNSVITLLDLGNMLWYTFGITTFSQTFSPFGITQTLRRFPPSGGALYPNEIYLYLKLKELPHGIYHYNVAHHSLELLREGEFDDYIEQSLGRGRELQTTFGIVFISTVFWRNFFKYNNFSYRLQGIDLGVVTGQMLEVVKRSGYYAATYYQFLDQAVNHLLGLSNEKESVYVIVSLSKQNVQDKQDVSVQKQNPQIQEFYRCKQHSSSDALCQQITPVRHGVYEKSRKITPCPEIIRMNSASMLHTVDSFCSMPIRQNADAGEKSFPGLQCLDIIPLPPAEHRDDDFMSVCSRRYSPGLDFVSGKIDLQQLAELLWNTVTSFIYQNDIDLESNRYIREGSVLPHACAQLDRLSLAVCLHQIEGIPDGAYLYNPWTHSLWLLHAGDFRMALQNGLSMQNVSMFQTPLCFHVIGDSNHLQETFGPRGYRIQQMEVGMVLQQLLLSASALGMNGHPFLGYDEALSDGIYNLTATKKTCLVQVPVGHFRTWSRLEGRIMR